MRFSHIPGDDDIFRQCVYPVAFTRKGAFAPQRCLHFSDGKNSVTTSVSWERFAPTVAHVHSYGCRLAAARNEKSVESEKPFDERRRSVYCGSYQVRVQAVREIAQASSLEDVLSADVVHEIENGEIAHANLIFTLSDDLVCPEATKTAIVDRLWNSMSGPLAHVCECDRDRTDQLSERLFPGPVGVYAERRSDISRFWYVVRFRILYWFWDKVLKRRQISL